MIPPGPLGQSGVSQAGRSRGDPPPAANFRPMSAAGRHAASSLGQPGDQASSNLAITSVSASPSRVHSWNAGSAIIVSI